MQSTMIECNSSQVKKMHETSKLPSSSRQENSVKRKCISVSKKKVLNCLELVKLDKATGQQHLCRVCLASGDHLKCLDTDKEISVFYDFFIVLTALQVDTDDGITNKICQTCVDKVKAAHEIRKLAQQSDATLRSMLESKNDAKELTHSPTGLDKIYGCWLCSKAFMYKSELKRHEHTHKPHYKCGNCNKMFGFKSSLRRHELQHKRGGRVPCQLCSSHFKDEKLLRRHVQYAHQGERYKCDQCEAELGSASALRSHRKRHLGPGERALRCRHAGCARTFNFHNHRRLHEATHTGTKHHFCVQCDQGFVQAHHLASHMATHLPPEQRVACGVLDCLKTFSSVYALKRHSAVHNNNFFTCSTCGKQLASNRSLQAHMQLCNTPLNNNIPKDNTACDFCKKFYARKYIKKHQLKCHQKILKASPKAHNPESSGVTEDIQIHATLEVKHLPKIQNIPNKITKHGAIHSVPEGSDRSITEEQDEILLDLSNESKCNSQEVVKDVVDMMDGSCQNNPHFNEEQCQTSQDLSVIVEDPIQGSNCDSCRQDVSKNNLDLDRSITSSVDPVNADALTDGCCKKVQQIQKNNNDEATSASGVRRRARMNDCKGFLGNCIVGNGTEAGSEDCICAKVNYEQEAPLPEYLTAPLLVALEQQGYYPS